MLELTQFIENNHPTGNFDRNKGLEIIEKHKQNDVSVAVVNSPITPGFVYYENATNQMIYNMILSIKEYLLIKQDYKEGQNL